MPLFNGTTRKPNGRVVSIGKSGFVTAGVVGGVAATGLLYGALSTSKNETFNNSTSSTTIQPDLLNMTTTEIPLNCTEGILVNSPECQKRLLFINRRSTELPDIINTTTEVTLEISDLSVNNPSTIAIVSTTTSLEKTVVEATTLKTEIGRTTLSSEILSARNTLEIIKEVDE